MQIRRTSSGHSTRGGDYQKEKYQAESIVVDNPPFSIFSEIVNWYEEHQVKYFLFAPSLAVLNYANRATAIALQATVEYENGAKVSTSFLTNLEDRSIRARTDPKLYRDITEASKEAAKDNHRKIPKYDYPDNIVTAAMMGKWSKYGINQAFTDEEAVLISALDEQKEAGKAIYGKGLLLSERAAAERAAAERAAAERAAAERAAAERAAAERAAAHRWKLSEREMQIVASLK